MMLPYKDGFVQRRRWLVGTAIIVVVAACLCLLPLGDSLARLSFDLPFLFRAQQQATNVVVVLEDRASLDALGQKLFPPARTVHARLVDRLREEGAKVIVFDILFRVSKPDEDAILASALQRHGRVVLGSALEISMHQTGANAGAHLAQITPPPEVLRSNAAGVGLLLTGNLDASFGVRRLLKSWRETETIAAVAARCAGVPVDDSDRWINFHGVPPSVDTVTLGEVLGLEDRKLPAGFFRGKIVFVGFDPSVTPASGERDVFATPYTRFGHNYAPGAEVLANSCANLINHNGLRRVSWAAELALVVLLGMLLVLLIIGSGRRWMLVVGVASFAVLTASSFVVQWKFYIWWNWLVPTVVELPLAILLGVLCPRLPRVAFISYRRDGGSDFAVMVMEALRARGCDVYLDVKDLGKGEWWPQLQAGIRAAPNFILVLSPNMFGQQKEDWVQKEIIYAMACGKNIIPIMREGFMFPPTLPTELQPITKLQAILHIHLHPDKTFDALEEFLGHRKWPKRTEKHPENRGQKLQ